MGKRIESRLQAIEQSSQALQAKGRRCFEQSLADPEQYHEGTLSMGLSRQVYNRAQIAALSAQGWQVTLLEWVSDGQGLDGPRVALAWE